jgi:hypothetical protein
MMSDALKNKLYRRIIGLFDFIIDLEDNDYFNNASNIAIKNYKIMIKYFIDHFSDIDTMDYQRLYLLINKQIIPDIRYVQRAKTRNIPWSLVSNLDEMLKKEFGRNYLLLFRPQWRFNFSVATGDFMSYLKYLLLIFFPANKTEINEKLFSKEKIHIFSFPLLEKTNVLLNSVIGHEIGHFYHKRWETDEYPALRDNYNKQLKIYYEGISPDEIFMAYDKTEEGLKILSGMYREIISDIYGYFLFGPSMIFSLYDFSIFETKLDLPAEKNNYYPPTKYRIRILMNHLLEKDSGIKEILSTGTDFSFYLQKHIAQINQYLSNKDDLDLLIPINEEKKLFENSLDLITENIKKSMSEEYLEYSNIDKLFTKLENGIPINELDGIPTDTAKILFAGWIYFIKINEKYADKEYVLNFQILMRLLLKSLHSSYIHKKYLNRGDEP